MAELARYPIQPERIGSIVAGNNLTQHHQYKLYESFQKDPEYLKPRYLLQCLDTDYEIYGEGFTVGGTSAGGNVALIILHKIFDTTVMPIHLLTLLLIRFC